MKKILFIIFVVNVLNADSYMCDTYFKWIGEEVSKANKMATINPSKQRYYIESALDKAETAYANCDGQRQDIARNKIDEFKRMLGK